MVAEAMWWLVLDVEKNANSAFSLVGVEVEVEDELGKNHLETE